MLKIDFLDLLWQRIKQKKQEKWKTTMFYDYTMWEQFIKHCMKKCASSTQRNKEIESNKKVRNARIKNPMHKKNAD